MCESDVEYKRFFSPARSRLVLASAWGLVTCYILVPHLAGLQGSHFVPGYAWCFTRHLSTSRKVVHYLIVVSLFLLLPLAVTIFSYRKVSRKIQEHNINLAMVHQSQRRIVNVSPHEIRISRSLFVMVFAFMLCWIPAWVIAVLTRFFGDKIPRNAQLLTSFSFNLSNTINPFIYAGMNPLFRKEFKSIQRWDFFNRIRSESESNNANNQQGSSKKSIPLAQSTPQQNIENYPTSG